MNQYAWLYVIGGMFAVIGIATVIRWLVSGWKGLIKTANNLVSTLKDATEIARAYREDLTILRQIAQSGPTPNFGDEPESIIPQQQAPRPQCHPLTGRAIPSSLMSLKLRLNLSVRLI